MQDTSQNAIQTYSKSAFRKDLFILSQLVTKDFKLKYRRSVLGIAWSVLNPLFMMAVQSIVFTYMFRHSIENYPLYLILGNVTFTLMNEATRNALTSITGAASLLKKIRIDRFVFPLQKVLVALVNYIFSFIAVAIVMVFFRVIPSWHVVFFPLILLLLIMFCIGLGLALSALVVFFRDVIHLWSVILTAWMYLTPIFWDPQMLIDAQAPTWILAIVHLNPMYNYVTAMRDIFLWHQTPSLFIFGMCAFWAVLILLIGIWVFRKNEHKFILYI